MSLFRLLIVLSLLLATSQAAQAGETFDTCTGFIPSLPAVITSQGTWCLDTNRSTAVTSGNAITVAANNVTIDCNGFKIGGLAAGDGSEARGIAANDRMNVSVRNCTIRGFQTGIEILGGGGHVVRDNRLDNNLYRGIYVGATRSLISGNDVYDTGGVVGEAWGILSSGDVVDNTVEGVYCPAGTCWAWGIAIGSDSSGRLVRGNRIRRLASDGAGAAKGIQVWGDNARVEGNLVAGLSTKPGTGIEASGDQIECRDNTVTAFPIGLDGCMAGSSGNEWR